MKGSSMIFGKKYKLSAKKKRELEKELKLLETKGREDVAARLDRMRQLPIDEEDYPFGDLLDDKNYLEKRIAELKDILNNCQVINEKESHDMVEIGSKVKVGFEGFEEIYLIVSSVEADPLNKKISDESPVGRALIGSRVGDKVIVDIGPVKKTFRILTIN